MPALKTKPRNLAETIAYDRDALRGLLNDATAEASEIDPEAAIALASRTGYSVHKLQQAIEDRIAAKAAIEAHTKRDWTAEQAVIRADALKARTEVAAAEKALQAAQQRLRDAHEADRRCIARRSAIDAERLASQRQLIAEFGHRIDGFSRHDETTWDWRNLQLES